MVGPRSPSESITSKHSYSKSPVAVSNGGKLYRHLSKDPSSRSRSITPRCRRPKTPPGSPPRKSNYSDGSKSLSRSPTPNYRRRRYDSPTPRSRGHHDSRNLREKPKPNRCIGVFGLSVYTTQAKIRDIFGKFGPIERIQMVIDQHTGRSRGFCFIYYKDLSDAKAAKEECCGLEIDERRIRVDYSITQRPHTPTPGTYMGHSRHRERSMDRSYKRGYKERNYDDYMRSRRPRTPPSPMPYGGRAAEYSRRRRDDRSRSRSRSPGSRRTRYY